MIQPIQNQLLEGNRLFHLGCDQTAHFLDTHETSFKVVLIASHLFRAGSMFAMMRSIPLPLPIAVGLLVPPSLLYRSAIERFCNFRFTLPSLAGGIAIWAGRAAMISFATKAAFVSLGAFSSALLGATSLAAYLIFICDLSNSDVERHLQNVKQRHCCS